MGCAVGRSTFELTKAFDNVVGIDYSNKFVDACNTMKGQGTMKYAMTREGELCDEFLAQVDSDLVRSPCRNLSSFFDLANRCSERLFQWLVCEHNHFV